MNSSTIDLSSWNQSFLVLKIVQVSPVFSCWRYSGSTLKVRWRAPQFFTLQWQVTFITLRKLYLQRQVTVLFSGNSVSFLYSIYIYKLILWTLIDKEIHGVTKLGFNFQEKKMFVTAQVEQTINCTLYHGEANGTIIFYNIDVFVFVMNYQVMLQPLPI
jgi:hypothetical protein